MQNQARLLSFIPGLLILALSGGLLQAAQYSGSVRAADQPVPGAMVTAKQGDAKVIAYTDENGRYTMDLAPGEWNVSVEMFEFTTSTAKVTIADTPARQEWTLDMPKLRERLGGAAGAETDQATAGAMAAAAAAQQTGAQAGGGGRGGRAGRGGRGGFGASGGQGGFGQQAGNRGGRGAAGATGSTGAQAAAAPGRGFQSAQVRAVQEGQPPAANPNLPPPPPPATNLPSDFDDAAGDEALLVNGSTSGGLAQSGMDEATRQRLMANGGGRGGGASFASAAFDSSTGDNLGIPASGMMTNDAMGLGGFGAAANNAGFAVGAAGAGGGGNGFTPGGGAGGGGGGRGGGGGGGGGRGGGRGGGNPSASNALRSAFGGQYNQIGNKRKNPYKPTGTIQWTGTNSVLNAEPFSLNGTPSQKPKADTNSYSATLGGPLVIPKIVKWPKGYYSFSYSGTHNLTGIDTLYTVPTAAELSGNFSALLPGPDVSKPTVIYDPTTGQPFVGNIIPQSRINPAALALEQYFPAPIYDNVLVQNFRLTANTPSDSQNIGVRFTAPINTKDRLIFNEQYQDRNGYGLSNFGEFRDTTSGSGLSASVGWSHSFKPRVNNTGTLTFSRNISSNTPYFANKTNIEGNLGITGATTQDPEAWGPPTISFTNFGSISDANHSLTRPQTMNFTDVFTYVIGRKHNLSFGYTFQKQQFNNLSYANTRGTFNFTGELTSQLNAVGQPIAGTGYDFADFLLGLPAASSEQVGATNDYLRQHNMNGYVNDDYRLSQGVSLSLGLRYEYFSPDTELRDHLANIVLNSTMTEAAVVTPGMVDPFTGSTLPSSLVRSDKEAFSPRLGMAWRPWQKHALVTRFGYSIFYSGSAYNQIAGQLNSQPPFVSAPDFTTQLSNPLTLQNGFFGNPTQTITDTYAVDPNYRLAYAQTWSATAQESLHWGLLLEVEYIGTKGTRLGIVEEPNRSFTNILPIAGSAQFTYQTSDGNSIYHAGQVRLTKRLTSGLAATALYTYGKSIDDVSSFSGPGGTVVQYINNLGLERGLSNFDVRNNLSTTFQYTSPFGIRGRFRNTTWLTNWLKGWATSGTFNLTSGTPMTATIAGNLSDIAGSAAIGGTLRAEATGEPIYAAGYPYFNPLAFTTPGPDEFGDAGRNTIPGLYHATFNANLRRMFRLGNEAAQRTLSFQLSSNNTLNHPTITGIGTTVNANTFGYATGASQMRTVTLLLRFTF